LLADHGATQYQYGFNVAGTIASDVTVANVEGNNMRHNVAGFCIKMFLSSQRNKKSAVPPAQSLVSFLWYFMQVVLVKVWAYRTQ
jgi:hypothetical protein